MIAVYSSKVDDETRVKIEEAKISMGTIKSIPGINLNMAANIYRIRKTTPIHMIILAIFSPVTIMTISSSYN